MDWKKIFRASLSPTFISIFLLFLLIGLQVASVFVEGETRELLKTINLIYSYSLVVIIALLYLWAGSRATKKYGLDPLSCGFAAGVSYFASSLISILINATLTFLVINEMISIGSYRPPEGVLATVFFGNIAGVTGVLYSVLCGFGLVFLGSLIATSLGGIGAIYASKRKN